MPTLNLKPGESTTAYVNGTLFVIKCARNGEIRYSRAERGGYTSRLTSSVATLRGDK